MFPDYVKFEKREDAEWYVNYLAVKNIKASVKEIVTYTVVPSPDK
jgi:hypothetical protein